MPWTAAEQEQQLAAKRIFMASGVSGGAVGLYAYARQLLEQGQLESAGAGGDDWIDARSAATSPPPAIGWALFHDLPNRLLGLHPDAGAAVPLEGPGTRQCLTQDRAAVLEDTFDARVGRPRLAGRELRRRLRPALRRGPRQERASGPAVARR